MMELPRPVRQAADYADALQAKLAAQADARGGEAAPAAQVTDQQGRQQIQQATEPGEAPARGVPEADAGQAPSADEGAKWKSRYASIRGKYDSEVPRLNDRVKELEAEKQKMAEELRVIREQAQKDALERQGLSQQDVDAYGEDMVNMVRRGVKGETGRLSMQSEQMRDELSRVRQELDSVKQAAARAEQEFARQRFMSVVGEECPQWQSINEDKAFLAWLQEPDPLYGFARMDALDRAAAAGDGHTAAKIFNQYLAERGRGGLGRQVSPARHAGQGQAASPTVWTSAMIGKFYDDLTRRNKYTEEEAARIEKEIADAVAAGRVVY